MEEVFNETFVFDKYKVVLSNYSLYYITNNNITYSIPSILRNRFNKETGAIIIENVYFTFNCCLNYQREQMFDFIAKGFDIYNLIK